MRSSDVKRKTSSPLAALLLVAIFGLAYSGASYYAGVLAEQQIRQYVQMPSSAGSVQARLIEHKTGIWQSSGVLVLENSAVSGTPMSLAGHRAGEVSSQTRTGDGSLNRPETFTSSGKAGESNTSTTSIPDSHGVTTLDLTADNPGVARPSEQHELPALIVHYQINHALWPTRMAQITWQAQPNGVMASHSRRYLSAPIELTGAGILSWNNVFESSLAAPAFSVRSDDSLIHVTAMTGQVMIDQQRLQIQMHWPQVQGQRQRPDLHIENLTLKVDTYDRFAGLGTSTIEMDSLQWDSLTARQVTMSGQATQTPAVAGVAPARMRLDLRARAQTLSLPGYDLQTVLLDGALVDVDLQAVQTLQRIWNETAGLQLLAPADLVDWRQALRTLVLQGMRAEIAEVSAQTGYGEVSGKAVLDLHKVDKPELAQPGKPVDFEKYLQSSGEVRIQGQGISATLTTLGLLTGFLTRTSDGVRATYELSQGKLQVSDKALPAQPVYMLMNRLLNALVVMEPVKQ